jgi:hypothetical protein
VEELFDVLVLRGHLTPFLPDWWEQIRWGEVAEIAAGWRKSCSKLSQNFLKRVMTQRLLLARRALIFCWL